MKSVSRSNSLSGLSYIVWSAVKYHTDFIKCTHKATRSSYWECMTAFAECSAGKHGKAAAFGQNTHISVHQRQMFVKLLSILQPCNVHGFCV